MIKGLTTSSKYITVSGGMASNYVNGYSGAQGVGNMRFNTSTQNMEVFDGNTWQILNMSVGSISLNHEAESLLDWAQKKRAEELEWQNLAKTNRAVKIAMDNVANAQEQLRVTATLAKDTSEEYGEVMEQASP